MPEKEPLRGIVLYRGDLEKERVVELASADPAVRAGRLTGDEVVDRGRRHDLCGARR